VTWGDHLYAGRKPSFRGTTASPRDWGHLSGASPDAQALRAIERQCQIEAQARLPSNTQAPSTEDLSVAVDPATAHSKCSRHVLYADEAPCPLAQLLGYPIRDRLDVVVVEDHGPLNTRGTRLGRAEGEWHTQRKTIAGLVLKGYMPPNSSANVYQRL
jgi:hypothetical protein